MFNDKRKNISNDIAIHQQITDENKLHLVNCGFLKPKENHTTFEYNPLTNTISIAKVEKITEVNFLTWKQDISKRKLIIDSNCYYVTALNINTSIKHFNRQYGLKIDIKNVNINNGKTIGGKHLNIQKEKIVLN